MKSMTGYAYKESISQELSVFVELKGYNSRFLDISVSLPSFLSMFESDLRSYIASRFKRGKIEVFVKVKEQNCEISVSVNRKAASAYYQAASTLADELSIKERPDLGLLFSLDGVLETDKKHDAEKIHSTIMEVLYSAADQFESYRQREGKHTEEDILSHLSILESNLELVTSQISKLESSIRENISSRFQELIGNQFDENRILAETAILLMKYTISEEVSRLSSHIKEFRLENENNPSPGKKLDFLCQEINREINTIGSKSNLLEISRAVVEMKNSLENIREQLRNVE